MSASSEVERVAAAMDGVYVSLGTRAGLFGSVGLLDKRSRTRLAEVALDAVRGRSHDVPEAGSEEAERWRAALDGIRAHGASGVWTGEDCAISATAALDGEQSARAFMAERRAALLEAGSEEAEPREQAPGETPQPEDDIIVRWECETCGWSIADENGVGEGQPCEAWMLDDETGEHGPTVKVRYRRLRAAHPEADRAPEKRAGQEEQWEQGSSGVGEADRAPEDAR